MKRGMHVVLFSLIALLAAHCVAQSSTSSLRLELKLIEDRYLAGEPLYLTVSVGNDGPFEATMLRCFNPGEGILSLEITEPGCEPRPFKPWVQASRSTDGYAEMAIRLCPGESYSSSLELTREGQHNNVFPSQPGNYGIRARYAISADLPGGPLDLWSDMASFEVRQPEDADRGAYDILIEGQETNKGGFWNALCGQQDFYARLLSDWPDSQYSPYAQFYLAQIHELKAELIPKENDVNKSAALQSATSLYTIVAEEQRENSARYCRNAIGSQMQRQTRR